MREENKNRKGSETDFIRYHNDKMKSTERNAFEKELQKDPFAEEASEGFSLVTPEEVSEDMADLQKQIKRRAGKRNRILFYRIAASVAVLMIISSVFIVVERKSTPKQIASSADQAESLEITESGPLTAPAEKKELPEKPGVYIENKAARAVVQQKNPEPPILPEDSRIAVYHQNKSLQDMELKVADKSISSEQTDVIPPSAERSKKSSVIKAEGKVISSEDNMPVAGASIVVKGEKTGVITDAGGNFSIDLPDYKSHILVASYIGMETKEFQSKPDSPAIIQLDPSLMALNEILVTASGMSRDKSEMEAGPEGYNPPSPEGGKAEFDKYIRENMQWPDTISPGQKATVVLIFSVHTDGTIDSIKIIRSPGKQFSDEAIRLLRSGPSWQPAVDNGQIIEDQVRLRIVFK